MNKTLLHLTLIPISPSIIKAIIERKPDHVSWMDLYTLSTADWIQLFGLRQAAAQKIVHGLSDTAVLEKEMALLEKHTLNWTSIIDPGYPELLKHIHLPPAGLYWQGSPLDNGNSLAVVGSRKANNYGYDAVQQLVPPLVRKGWTIVSGGALGIDAIAHKATLDAQGKAIVVLGSGLLQPAPRSNIRLFNQILDAGGTLVSSFPLQAEPYPSNFPIRNRIIAGLSRGCLVVQAAAKSGARITAQFALDQGRDVFAVPGSIKDPLSAGCHKLMHEGAKLVHDVEDILSEYNNALDEKKLQHNVFASIDNDQDQKDICTAKKYSNPILAACIEPISVEDLANKIDMQIAQLQEELFNLQLDDLIQQDFTGLWRVC